MKRTKLKIAKSFFFACLFLGFYTCKNEIKNPVKETNNDEINEQDLQKDSEKQDNLFIIRIIAKIKNDDFFRAYYGYDGENFEEKRVILVEVKGGEEDQEIVFNFPPNEIPEKFRIHTGKGNKNEEILLKEMHLSYNDSDVIIDKNNFNNYFNTSSSMKFNPLDGTLLPLNPDNGIYDPHFASNKELSQIIIKL
jgi:hypothetical protein